MKAYLEGWDVGNASDTTLSVSQHQPASFSEDVVKQIPRALHCSAVCQTSEKPSCMQQY